ncbi:MAG: peptidoglycan DD-metalloendopeptidase family protein [Flavobacteriales bacterium]|nr:peptidoglycan DD-metalloendopeptidase family protein [Flavobacteriales bacterium]MCB9203505.1 peptidoglycan DD-metalloendopeptidase family protein [Flavobacteriales bacterium]
MSKVKFQFDKRTLTYRKVELSTKQRLLTVLGWLAGASVFAFLVIILFTTFFDSPKEKRLKREIAQLEIQYKLLGNRMNRVDQVLAELQEKDDDIYRVIFEAEPIPNSVREAGFGGVNRYKDLERLDNADIVIGTTKRLDELTKKLVVQSRSFDEVITLAKNKEEMLASIPAIQPVSNEKLTRVASGFNWRIHPIYKVRHFHTGIDFTAPRGTEIYATGDGVIEDVVSKGRGYGNHVIVDHGFGYQTLYAHMSRFKVRKGEKVKRGDVIGYVGSTGTSTAPHLHYEVIKNGEKINPMNFFFNDLSPEEYEKVIELSSQSNQSFD